MVNRARKNLDRAKRFPTDTLKTASKTITVENTAAADATEKNNNIEVVIRNCAPFTNCFSEINNTQRDNTKYINVVMPVYDSTGFSENYSKTSGSLWQYYDEPALPVVVLC